VSEKELILTLVDNLHLFNEPAAKNFPDMDYGVPLEPFKYTYEISPHSILDGVQKSLGIDKAREFFKNYQSQRNLADEYPESRKDFLMKFDAEVQKFLDSAMTNTGGIDLTPASTTLQDQHSGEGIKFHLDPAMLAQLQNAPGFVPVIINMQPLTNLQQFLGIQDSSPAPVTSV
jgi:hypothetical protein